MSEKHLFSTDLELKDFLPMTAGEILAEVLSFVGDAERRFIVPIVGQTTFDEINNAYNNGVGTPSPEQTTLLLELRRPLAAFAMMIYIPHGQVLISPSGMRIASTDTHKTAFKWQIEQLIDEYFELASNRKESLIKFLFSNLATYTVYAASDEFENNHQFLVNYASEFNNYHNISLSRAAFDAFLPALRDIEYLQVREAISEEYYDELIGKIRSSSLTTDDMVILPWLQAAVTKLTIAESVQRNIAKLNALGVLTFSRDATSAGGDHRFFAAADNDKSTLIRSCQLWGNAYVNKTRDYLNANASASRYITFFDSDEYVDPDTQDPTSDEFIPPPFANDEDGAKIFLA